MIVKFKYLLFYYLFKQLIKKEVILIGEGLRGLYSAYAKDCYFCSTRYQPRFYRDSEEQVLNEILELIQPQSKVRVIDIACGTGTFLNKLKRENRGIECIGIDFSQGMIDIAEKTTSEDIVFILGNAHEPPEDLYNSADVIVCKNSFYHFKPERAIDSFAVLAKDNAYLILTSLMEQPNLRKLYTRSIIDSFVVPLLELLQRRISLDEVWQSVSSSRAHIFYQKQVNRALEKPLSLNKLSQLLKQNSFQIKKVKPGYYCGTQYLIIAQKR